MKKTLKVIISIIVLAHILIIGVQAKRPKKAKKYPRNGSKKYQVQKTENSTKVKPKAEKK